MRGIINYHPSRKELPRFIYVKYMSIKTAINKHLLEINKHLIEISDNISLSTTSKNRYTVPSDYQYKYEYKTLI